jgi:hypothetical protein
VKRLLCATFILLQFLGAVARAAEKLEVDLFPFGLHTRTESPILTEVRFKWDGTRVLQGRLEMEFLEGRRVLGRYISSDLALTTGEQRFRMLLQPMPSPYSDSQVEVQMKFVTANAVFELTPSSIFMPTSGERSFVIAWCSARLGGDPQPQGLEQTFFFEQFAALGADNLRRQLSTSFARLAPEDLPVQPLAYTSFDAVVLTAEAFKDTHERQLQTLARWVRGGGSLCVFVGNGLQGHHIAFLNQLADSKSGPAFSAGSDGSLLSVDKKISCLHSGVGRSVIVTGSISPEPGLNSSDWRQAMAFLWKLRGSQVRAVATTGHWNTNTPTEVTPQSSQNNRRRAQMIANGLNLQQLEYGSILGQRFGVQPTELGNDLLTRLMPQTVRLIPFSALAVILMLFVLMIGPVDYYVLGLFRRRRYTWILFPATSICFTLVTVTMANHYLGLRDQRHSLIVVDLDPEGTALRWFRYELLFAARDKEAITELKDVLWSPLNTRTLADDYSMGYRPTDMAERSTPLYHGTLPVHFQIRESLRQWRPELNRAFSFEPPPVPLPSNWRAVEKAWPDLEQVRSKLSTEKPFVGDVCGMIGDSLINCDPLSGGMLLGSLLPPMTSAERAGLFDFVSQISPTSGGNFEDASAMDVDSNDSVLLITTRVGEDVVVYRRFFHGN